MSKLQFIYEPEPATAAGYLAERLTGELQAGKRVLWLVSGGSNVAISLQAIASLPAKHIAQLRCLLTDERYGVPGHADSNWQQLSAAGFMASGVDCAPVLLPGLTIEDTCQRYIQTFQAAIDTADCVIGQFGIGGDGHIAGILPQSPAADEQQVGDALAVSYDGGTYQRITLTAPALRHCQAAYAYVYGDTKRDALQRLHDHTVPFADQPSQLLKSLPEAFIYTDQHIGDTV